MNFFGGQILEVCFLKSYLFLNRFMGCVDLYIFMKIAHALKGMRLLQNSLYSISRDVPERDNNRNILNFPTSK